MIRVGAKELPLVYLLLVLTIEWAFCLEPMGIASDGTVILGFKNITEPHQVSRLEDSKRFTWRNYALRERLGRRDGFGVSGVGRKRGHELMLLRAGRTARWRQRRQRHRQRCSLARRTNGLAMYGSSLAWASLAPA